MTTPAWPSLSEFIKMATAPEESGGGLEAVYHHLSQFKGEAERVVDGWPSEEECLAAMQTWIKHAGAQTKALAEERERTARLEKALQKLLNKVNLVTAPWRHRHETPKGDALNTLSNRQIEAEQTLAAYKAPNVKRNADFDQSLTFYKDLAEMLKQELAAEQSRARVLVEALEKLANVGSWVSIPIEACGPVSEIARTALRAYRGSDE